MKKVSLLLALLFTFLLSSNTQAQSTKWDLDKYHSNISFTVAHMVISEVTGNFKSFNVNLVADKADFTDAKFDVLIPVKSINTNDENRDKHLIGTDFFDADKFPNIEFKGIQLKKVGNQYKAVGNLIMKGVSKQVEFDVVYKGTLVSNKKTRTSFKVSGIINRDEYGVSYNSVLEVGGFSLGKEVTLNASFEFIKAEK